MLELFVAASCFVLASVHAPNASEKSSAAPPNRAKRGRLLRLLGVGFGLAVIAGSTIGIGILRAPGLVAGQISSPSAILLVWLIGGVYTLLGSICFTELGAMLPRAGGYYVYSRRAFGDTMGFAVGWTDWLAYCAVLGYVSIAIGEFTAVLVPPLAPWVRLVAIAALVALPHSNWPACVPAAASTLPGPGPAPPTPRHRG